MASTLRDNFHFKPTNMTIEKIAQTAYEINRSYCQSLGDYTFAPWDDAPDWQKSTNINGVRFHLENPDAGPEASHESWMKQKLDEGWTYGPVKNPELKEHHCIRPFNELPREQQAKDFLFRQTVHSLKHLISPPEITPQKIETIVDKSTYSVPSYRVTDNGLEYAGEIIIQFCKGSKDDQSIPRQEGVLTETLIAVAKRNLEENNVGHLGSRDTSTTITHLDNALLWQAKRAIDRKARGVQGTYKK